MKYIELVGGTYEDVMSKVKTFIYQDYINRVISIKTVRYEGNFVSTIIYK